MKFIKFISINCLCLIFIASLNLPLGATQRVKDKPLIELSDPQSPSYIPCPYPKNKKEVLINLKHYAETSCNSNNVVAIKKDILEMDQIFLDVFNPNSPYKVKNVVKVKNRLKSCAKDYLWIIYIVNGHGNIVLTTAMSAEGHFLSAGCTTEKDYRKATSETRRHWDNFRKELSKKDLCNILSKALDRTIETQQIKKTERCVYRSKISNYTHPLWEITLNNDDLYFYSIRTNTVYQLERKIPWQYTLDRKKMEELRTILTALQNDQTIDTLVDTVSEELWVLKKIRSNSKNL